MFEKEFIEQLKKLHQEGNTYEAIAAITGLSMPAVARAINGSRPPKNLSVDALVKAFPNMTISLYGDNTKISVRENAGNVVGVNHGSVTYNPMEPAMDKIIASEDLSDSEKIKVLKVLKK